MNKDKILEKIQSIGKPKEPINKLTEMKCTLIGNKKEYKESREAGMLDFQDFDGMYKQLLEEGAYDMYDISGDMINHFMLTHPKLKFAWEDMNADERWNFVEAIHYGIESLHRADIHAQYNIILDSIK